MKRKAASPKKRNPDEALEDAGGAEQDELWIALKQLDHLLEQAIAKANGIFGPQALADRFRGLYISQEEVGGLLNREPGVPLLWTGDQRTKKSRGKHKGGLNWLQQAFELSDFEMDVILIALAPELDLKYERLYAYLQDDVTKKRPTVELALNLLSSSVDSKVTNRMHFSEQGGLIRQRLLHLIPDPNQIQSSLLAQYLKLDEQIIRLILGTPGFDTRLATWCQRIEPVISLNDVVVPVETKNALLALVTRSRETRLPLRMYFHGPRGIGKRQAAEALARAIAAPVFIANLATALEANKDLEQELSLLFREAWFQDAMVYMEGIDLLCGDQHARSYEHLFHTIADAPGVTILSGEQPWTPPKGESVDVIDIPFDLPDFLHRKTCWQVNLEKENIAVSVQNVDVLAERFRLTPTQITNAVLVARNRARWRITAKPPTQKARRLHPDVTSGDLFAAARAQSGHDLTALTQKITPKYTWEDIVLPEDVIAQLREICQRVTHQSRVLGEWGFDQKLSLGKGSSALFAGPSGTGKTMAAEIIANELGLDLYKIDLAEVISKYIGETEKNLERIFRAAENANAMLFFDEADAWFGKRSEVRDSHDRYANIEISYLLQKMEEQNGIAILSTNLRHHLDEAFIRRLAFTIPFPFPDEASRLRIWTGMWPAATPLAEDVDLDFLAQQFNLSGGNIKNSALAAAYLSADDGSPITMAHLLHAIRREYQKMGKTLTDVELKGSQRDIQLVGT